MHGNFWFHKLLLLFFSIYCYLLFPSLSSESIYVLCLRQSIRIFSLHSNHEWGIHTLGETRFKCSIEIGGGKQIINSKAKLFIFLFFRVHKQTFSIWKISSLSSCWESEREGKVVKIVGKHKFVCFWLCLNSASRLYALTSMKKQLQLEFVVVEQPCNKSCMICVQFCRHKFWLSPVEYLEIYVNVCVEKTFQLSWLIIKLFSLSLASSHCKFKRHIAPLIYNNNIDFDLKSCLSVNVFRYASVYFKNRSPLAFQRKISFVHSWTYQLH